MSTLRHGPVPTPDFCSESASASFAGHGRRSIRLRNYDYSRNGPYFVTFCTHHRARILSRLRAGEVVLTPAGSAVRDCWLLLPRTFPHVRLDALAIMPDHVHAVLWIVKYNCSSRGSPAPITTVVGVWKSYAARRINIWRDSKGSAVWQRNYYERIVRGREALSRIRSYIRRNPGNWME